MRDEDYLKDSVTPKTIGELPTLAASGIAEYIRFNCCPRFFKLKLDKTDEHSRNWQKAFKPVSPLLFSTGKALEEQKIAELKDKATQYYDFSKKYDPRHIGWRSAWKNSLRELTAVIENQLANADPNGAPVLLYQVPMIGRIGVWEVPGIADLIGVWPCGDGKVRVRIFELKSSWKEQTAHRIQVAIYVMLLSGELADLASKIEFEGGVINKETDLTNLSASCLPRFKLDPLIQDVERLLCENGELNRIHQTPLSEVEYQLCWRCDNCGFNEFCIIDAVEAESIALLNLSRGEQNTLKNYGIKQLEDLARLKAVPNASALRPYDFKGTRAVDKEKVSLLTTDPVVGSKIDGIIERSQFMLGGIRPNSPFALKSRCMPWIPGTGYGSLPEDSPATADWQLSFMPDGMIRVYLFVEWDYMLDVISLISARVSCTKYRGETVSVSKIIKRLPDEHKEGLDEEKNLLEAFFKDLTDAITKIAVDIESPEEAPIHLYFFSRYERDILMEAVRRQPSLISAKAVRDLLGLRQAIDQPMFSIIQDEVQHRKALKYHSSGLLPILEQTPYFDRQKWRAKRKDDSSADLNLIFHDGFFNYIRPYSRNPNGTIHFIEGIDRLNQKEGFYPARARFGNQIPIEYVWGAKGRLDTYDEGGKHANALLERRKWCDYAKTRRITDEELTLMGEKLCLVLEHIERFLSIRNRRLGKKPINIPKIAEFSLGPATLERSCREFLDLEYFAKRQDLYQHYALMPNQRVASGRSVIFECTNVFESERDFTVQGKLLYEGIGLPKADCVANACRVKGSDGSSSGDWMVITELRRNEHGLFEEAHERAPSKVANSARVIINKVDLKKSKITVKVVTWPSGRGSKYLPWHNLPTTDPQKAQTKRGMQLFEAGRFYIVDELADDILSERAARCLDYAKTNALYCLLEEFLTGKPCTGTHKPLPKQAAECFLSWIDTGEFPPNPEQRRFIDKVFDEEPIVMLQGPPGTGKTQTLQLTLLAHVAAHRAVSNCRVLMVAPTHKAIQEFVSKLSLSWRQYHNAGGHDLDDLKIYRVLSNDVSMVNALEGVTYVNYNEDEKAVEELTRCLMNQTTLSSEAADNPRFPLVLCVTPPGLYGLMKKIGGLEPPWSEGFFDLLIVDEASMMRVPELILSGSFLSKSSQILVAGDHRQLPPIQTHNWEKEDRRTLEEMASFLSAMDFLRLLRNEDLGNDRITRPPNANIPAERLCESHRCHRVVAEFLREWVYEKDKIEFHSWQEQTLEALEPQTEGLQAVLEPENVFVLIVHDEAQSFQSNLVEALIADSLVRHVNPDSVGVITPHNAQKGLLKNMLADGYADVRVDTVERYQGGEADFIIISTTVSDPDYIRTESDFLLNLNRINVAISRMKKKIVIIASRSIFEFMPGDAKDYDKAILWRGIAQTVGFTAKSAPTWKGTLQDFLGHETNSDPNIEVYTKNSNP
ncbi:MAG: AAA domain-containing protein [Candidatus Bathyarchaeota archaeon]|nr:AAA domain-containing protein [Candidatus Bathyarchaeota archaeon]